MNKIIVLISILGMLIGCAASGPIFKKSEPQSQGQATIYIYRPNQFFNAGGWPEIFVDDNKLFALKNQGYGVVQLPPGEHKIKAEGSMLFTNWYPGPMELTHTFEANKEYFVRVIPQLTSGMLIGSVVAVTGDAQISLIPEKSAMPEISETRRVY